MALLDDILAYRDSQKDLVSTANTTKPLIEGQEELPWKRDSSKDKFIDYDTIIRNGRRERIAGIDAPELPHMTATGILKPGEQQGASVLIPEFIKQNNYNIPVEKNPTFGRTTIDFQNKKGESLGDAITRNQLVPVSEFTTQKGYDEMVQQDALAAMFPEMLKTDANKYLASGIQAKKDLQKSLATQGYTQDYVPKIQAYNPQELQSYKATFSNKGIEELTKEFNFQKEKSQRTDIADVEVQDAKDKMVKLSEQLYKAASTRNDFYSKSSVLTKGDDRGVNNQAYDQLTQSAIGGVRSIGLWSAGQFQALGDEAKIDYLSRIGRNAAMNIRADMAAAPETQQSLVDAMSNNNGTWAKLGAVTQVIGNSLASSSPTMLAMALGGWSAMGLRGIGAIGTADAALAGVVPSALLFAGKNYEAQPEGKKDFSLSLGTGTLEAVVEKLALDNLPGLKGSIFNVSNRSKIIEAMVAKGEVNVGNQLIKINSKEQAKAILEDMTKKEIVAAADKIDDIAKQQFLTKESFARGTAKLGTESAIQGGTEGFQQIMEMYGQKGTDPLDPQYQRDFTKQLMDAAGAGVGFATAFHIPTRAINAAQWHSISSGMMPYQREIGEIQQYQAENWNRQANSSQPKFDANGNVIQAVNPGYASVEDMATDNARQATRSTSFPSVESVSDLPASRGFVNTIKEMVTDPLIVFRDNARGFLGKTIYKEDGTLKDNLIKLHALFNGEFLPGASAAKFKQDKLGGWVRVTEDFLASRLGVNKDELNSLIADARTNYWFKGQELPVNTNDAETNKRNSILNNWRAGEELIRQDMINEARNNGVPTTHLMDEKALLESSMFDPIKVRNNKQIIVPILESLGLSRYQANSVVDNLISKNKNKVASARSMLSSVNAFADPRLSPYFNPDVFESSESLKERLADDIMKAKYFGPNGKNLAKLLAQAYDNGEFGPKGDPRTEKAFKRAVGRVQVSYEIANGEYHRPEDDSTFNKIVSYASTFTMVAVLGKAMFSSITEFATAMLGTPADKIGKQLGTAITEFGHEIRGDLNRMAPIGGLMFGISSMRKIRDAELQNKLDDTVEKIQDIYNQINSIHDFLDNNPNLNSKSNEKINNKLEALDKELTKLNIEVSELQDKYNLRSQYNKLGFNGSGYGAQAKYEYNEVGLRKMMNLFATIIGLQAQENANKLAALSIAGDVMMNHLRVLSQVDKADRITAFATGKGLSKEQANALYELQQYGVDVYRTLGLIDKYPTTDIFSPEFMNNTNLNDPQIEEVQKHLGTALSNFIDQRVNMPNTNKMPKFMHDPRLRLVTLMGRFTAVQTSTMIPRLYKQYIKDGHAGMRYSAFFTIVSALATAYMANMIKDVLAYGEESPYIKGKAKKFQRTVFSSGLLGRGESLVDAMMPLYPQSEKKDANLLEKAYDFAKDKSPQIGYASKFVEGAGMIAEGNTNKGLNKMARNIPLAGSFPIATRTFVDMIVGPDAKKGNK